MFRRVQTANFPKTVIRYQNTAWARHLGFEDALGDDDLWCNRFARFIIARVAESTTGFGLS